MIHKLRNLPINPNKHMTSDAMKQENLILFLTSSMPLFIIQTFGDSSNLIWLIQNQFKVWY